MAQYLRYGWTRSRRWISHARRLTRRRHVGHAGHELRQQPKRAVVEDDFAGVEDAGGIEPGAHLAHQLDPLGTQNRLCPASEVAAGTLPPAAVTSGDIHRPQREAYSQTRARTGHLRVYIRMHDNLPAAHER